MKRYLWIFIVLIIIALPKESHGQIWKLKRYEAGVGLGSSHAWTDIGLTPDGVMGFQFLGIRPNLSFQGRYYISSMISTAVDLNFIWLGGVDDPSQRARLYYYNSLVFEPALRAEIILFGTNRGSGTTALFNRRGMINNYSDFHLFAFGGVGGAISKANVREQETNLEVVNNPGYYNNTNFGLVFPVGLGIKFSLDADWSFSAEIGARISLTDYLDGYSSQYSEHNDFYYLTNFKAIYKLRTGRNGLPVFKRRGGR